MKIKNVLICGLGAVGVTYANKLKDVCNLFVLADEKRVNKYMKNPLKLNDKVLNFKYVLPSDKKEIDLIIIATKADGLNSAIDYIKNYVGEDTVILSLINGITSEKEIASVYGWEHVLHSYFIGHSAVRQCNCVTQDGVGKIVFGSPYKENSEKVKKLAEFFEYNKIDYEIPKDIIYSLWLKFTMNIFSNQPSAIMKLNFGQMKTREFKEFAKKIIAEVQKIAQAEGVNGVNKLEADALSALDLMSDDGKTSMLQDILEKRKTEVDIFAGEIIRLGKKHKIETPYNQVMYDMIRVCEEI